MALDSQRRIYVAEQTNQRVQKVDNGGTYFGEVGGTAGSGDGQFQGPLDVAIDGSDNIYVVDSGNHRIQVFDPGLNFLTVIGGSGSGDGQFNFPIALDVSGNFLYVADAGNFRIQKFDISNVWSSGGSNGISFADEWGTPGTGNGQFASPRPMAVDGNGDLWVVDRDNMRCHVATPSRCSTLFKHFYPLFPVFPYCSINGCRNIYRSMNSTYEKQSVFFETRNLFRLLPDKDMSHGA